LGFGAGLATNFLSGAGASQSGRAFAGLRDTAESTALNSIETSPRFHPIGGGSPIPEVLDEIIPGEKVGTGLLRRYEGRINTEGLAIKREMDAGDKMLEAMNLGRKTQRGWREPTQKEVEEVFKPL